MSQGPARRLWLARDDGPEDGASFDALTDLFLGEVSRTRRPSGGGDEPKLRLTRGEADESDASDTNDGRGAAAPNLSPPPVNPPRPTPARIPAEPFVECVVVGNLPVLASAWASQYVREVARAAARPVAYLRVQAGYVTVEIVGEPAEGEAGAAVPVIPSAADLDQALKQAARITERWVVRVDDADEAAIASRASVRLVTLITGPDEAARVHAYGSLKELGERLPTGEASPVVRVAVMSATESDAAAAGRKLVETVKQFLGREVQHAVCSAKIRATRAAQLLFNGRMDQPTSRVMEMLEQVLEAGGGAAVEAASEPVVAAAPAVVETPRPSRPVEVPRVEVRAPEPIVAAPVTPVVRAPEPAAAEPAPEPEAPISRVDDVALWAAEPERSVRGDDADTLERELASFIPGCRMLGAECPYAAAVQIAVDGEGAVHLLARSAGPGEDEATLGALMVASAWVGSHAGLLGAVSPGLKAASRTMHLFTATPKASRRLLETDVRVHVLAPVRVGGRVGWCCVELN